MWLGHNSWLLNINKTTITNNMKANNHNVDKEEIHKFDKMAGSFQIKKVRTKRINVQIKSYCRVSLYLIFL